jgi:hypothetical protein
MWLSETELQNLTKRVKPSAQVRAVRGAKTMKKDQ